MYRIELTPGEVTVFRTIEELATGVRNGLITSKARIYHNASDKWLPIEFHPHYKQALDLNAGHAGDTGTHKHAAPASKQRSPKQSSPTQGSPKSGGSKPSKDGFTFLNVPISPVTPLPKSKPRGVADLPYIDDDPPPASQPTARPSAENLAVDHAPVASPLHHSTVHPSTVEDRPAVHAPTVSGPAHDAPIEHSPAYDLDPQPSREQQPAQHVAAQGSPAHTTAAHQLPVDVSPTHSMPAHDRPEPEVLDRNATAYDAMAHDGPARYSPVEHAPAYEAPPAHHHAFERILADETPLYRSPAQRSEPHEAEAHAAFEANLPPEPVRIEEPIRDAPRSRLAVEELFAPPAPRAPALPPVSASPVLELPQISYPEIIPADPPVAVRASGSRARRTLHLAGAALLLAAGGYASTTVFSFGRQDGGFNAASTMADRPVVPVRTTAPSPDAAAVPTRAEPHVTMTTPTPARAESPRALSPKAPSTPAAVPFTESPAAADAPLPPASSGFAPALESRAIVTAPRKPAPRPDAVIDSTALAPAIDMQIAVPDLQGAESLAAPPRQKGDSAMKRILRALSGKKDPQ